MLSFGTEVVRLHLREKHHGLVAHMYYNDRCPRVLTDPRPARASDARSCEYPYTSESAESCVHNSSGSHPRLR
jgi:hypothetical protein